MDSQSKIKDKEKDTHKDKDKDKEKEAIVNSLEAIVVNPIVSTEEFDNLFNDINQ